MTGMTRALMKPAEPSHGPRWWRRWWRGLVWLVQLCWFVALVVDELVTAWWGVPPVLPRVRLWGMRARTEWRVYRAGVTDGEVIEGDVRDGVWH